MDSKPVLVLVTAENCSACKQLKARTWGTLKSEIIKLGAVRIIEISLNTTADLPSENFYPIDIKRYIRWFPTFLLFTSKSWYAASPEVNKGSKSSLEGVVFAGKFEGGILQSIPGIGATQENVLKWLREELNNNSLFRTSTSGTLPPINPSSISSTQSLSSPSGGVTYMQTYGSCEIVKLHCG